VSTALVLPAEAVSGQGPVTFPGLPGVWTPGEPIEVAAFVAEGIFSSEDAMLAIVNERGVPLELAKVKKGAAPLPERANHISTTAVEEQRPEAHEPAAAAEEEGEG